jgi:hypothetical protein
MAQARIYPSFLDVSQEWHDLFTSECPPDAPETAPAETEARREALHRRFVTAEAALLAWRPTSPAEIIGMLEAIVSDEWVTPAQASALRAIQQSLAAPAQASGTESSARTLRRSGGLLPVEALRTLVA